MTTPERNVERDRIEQIRHLEEQKGPPTTEDLVLRELAIMEALKGDNAFEGSKASAVADRTPWSAHRVGAAMRSLREEGRVEQSGMGERWVPR